LKPTKDRIFGTSIEAVWTYTGGEIAFNEAFEEARRTILEVFATHDSLGVQQTIFAMGEAVLAQVAEIDEIAFTMPNQHRIPMNLEPFGMSNANEIFVTTSEPYGLIKGTIRRK
jgi:urate oxidase